MESTSLILSSVFASVSIWNVIIAGITLYIVYWFLTRKHGYWKEVGIPYVSPVPIIGSMGQMFSRPLHEVELRRYQKKGRIYGTYEASNPGITVGDPDVVRNILVKDFQFFTGRRSFKTGNPLADNMVQNLQGEDWKRIRSIITPTFTTGKMKQMTSIFVDCAKSVASNLRNAALEKKPLDMKKLFGAFTMDVIASAAFGTKIDSHNDPENPFVIAARNSFAKKLPWRAAIFFFFPRIMKLFKINAFPTDTLNFFRDVTLRIINERKRTGQKRNDFLQLLIDSTKENLEKEVEASDDKDLAQYMAYDQDNQQIFKPKYITKSLSTDELIAQCIIFFLAGYDTTASTLTFTAYELALNPEIQDRLAAEIDEAIREKGGLTYDVISEMKYLDKVFAETLRKYPPAPRLERRAEEDYIIKEHNITVPKNTIVGIPVYAIHHDPKHYPDPEKYDPERFNQENKSTRYPYTYLPFGAGPRNCIAMRFALMEAKVCMAFALSQFRFSTCSKTQVPLKYFTGQFLMQPKEVMLQVGIRSDKKK